MKLRYLLPCALAVWGSSTPSHAGPLRLILRGDARDFALDETTTLAPQNQTNLLVSNLATLPGVEFGTALLSARYAREWTYRRTQGEQKTRVASGGEEFFALWKLGEKRRAWNFGLSVTPGEFEKYRQRSADEFTDFNGDFSAFNIGVGREWGKGQNVGFSFSKTQLQSPFSFDPLDLGDVLPDVTRLDFDYQETALGAQWERETSSWRTRLGLRALHADFQTQAQGAPLAGGEIFRARLPFDASGFGGDLLLSRKRGNQQIDFSLTGETREGEDDLFLLSPDGTSQATGRGYGKWQRLETSLFWRRKTPRSRFSAGLEHLQGYGELGLQTRLGPLFPDDPLAQTSTAQGEAQVAWRATLLRAGWQQQFKPQWQGGVGLALGKVGGRASADGRADFLFGIGSRTFNALGELGPRYSVIPSFSLAYTARRARLSATYSQYIPLPKRGGGDDDTPPPVEQPKATTFGGGLLVLQAQWQF